jgi:tetratricopeptide (TPR) repeat protein
MENTAIEKQTLRILFLASAPKNQGNLRLGTELQEIRNRLASNTAFEIRDRQAVKPDDVLQTILNYKPHIVHFSGHGQDTGEICFEDERGDSKTIPPDALASLFQAVTDYVKCVLINTCFSEKQALAISQYVPIVIGTKKEITDSAAIKFSTGFYTALDPDLSQKNLLKAFEIGRIAIRFESLPENLTPIIIQGAPEVRFSSEVDTAFQGVSKPRGLIFQALVRGLTLIGKKMGVSDDIVAKIIEDKVKKMELHNNGVSEYEKYLLDILKDEYPLSDISNLALQQLQNGLELSNEDVLLIKGKVLSNPNQTSAEKWYDRGRKQSDYNNIEKAIEYFTKAVEKDSDYSGAYFERGFCYDKLSHFTEAINDFTKAIEFNNKWEIASSLSLSYFYRARAYDALQIEDEKEKEKISLQSLDDWNKSIELSPHEPQAYYGRALVYDKLDKIEEALSDFKKAYEISKPEENKRNIALGIGRCYIKLGNLEEARKYIEMIKSKSDTPIEEELDIN